MGIDFTEEAYAAWNPYYRNDNMTKSELCRHVSTAKRMMQIKYELESKEKIPLDMLK